MSEIFSKIGTAIDEFKKAQETQRVEEKQKLDAINTNLQDIYREIQSKMKISSYATKLDFRDIFRICQDSWKYEFEKANMYAVSSFLISLFFLIIFMFFSFSPFDEKWRVPLTIILIAIALLGNVMACIFAYSLCRVSKINKEYDVKKETFILEESLYIDSRDLEEAKRLYNAYKIPDTIKFSESNIGYGSIVWIYSILYIVVTGLIGYNTFLNSCRFWIVCLAIVTPWLIKVGLIKRG